MREHLPLAFSLRLLITAILMLASLSDFSRTWNDSLWRNWKNTKLPDSVRLASIQSLIYKYYALYDNDSTIILTQLQLDLALKTGNKRSQAQALLTQGQACYGKGENMKAIELERKSYKAYEEIKDKLGMGNVLCNLGNVFLEMGNFADAVDHYTQSMKVAEANGNKNLVAANLANLSIIAFSQADYKKAMEYNARNLKINEELGDKYALSYSYRNIGKVHEVKHEYLKAIHAFSKAYKYSEESNDENGMGYCLNYLGAVYHGMKEYNKAEDYFTRSLAIAEKHKDTYSISENLNHIGNCHIEKKEYAKALDFCKRAYAIASKTELVLLQRDAALSLYKIYRLTGKYRESLLMHEEYSNIKDTILSEENRKGVLKKEIQYKYDKQALSDSLSFIQKQQLNEIEHEAQLSNEKNQRYILYGGLFFAVVLGAVSFRGYQRKKHDNEIISSQKKLVEHQKDIVEEKQKEIIDSISYAKRIQDAILPPPDAIQKYLPESFVYYKPKDIVAGDFYWMEIVSGENANLGMKDSGKKMISEASSMIFIAAADCTGHGVPGAMVSVVCSNALNRSVKEFGLRDPAGILNKTRELVIETFNKSEKEVKDGMDISLCCIPYPVNNEMTIKWAGANNPLWIINAQRELTEIKPDKQPIGYFEDIHSFTTHTIKITKGDTLYLFTDGFQDQFGEASNKKFKSAQMRKLFLSVQDKNMPEQKDIIEKTFNEWRGNFEQVDDLCILGLRL
ncbi:MAG TPA: tetratricopeptide repeat protein [Bacteroidia bacterium]